MTSLAPEEKRMEAGRELDALVAEKVMGCEWTSGVLHPLNSQHAYATVDGAEIATTYMCPEYSTDISAAWTVVEKIGKPMVRLTRARFLDGVNDTVQWQAGFGMTSATADRSQSFGAVITSTCRPLAGGSFGTSRTAGTSLTQSWRGRTSKPRFASSGICGTG